MVKLRLLTSSDRIEKFMSWGNYEIALKAVEDGIYVAIYFREIIKPRKT